MEKEFIPYEQALALKELGFDEPCFAFYEEDTNKLVTFHTDSYQKVIGHICLDRQVNAPTFSQAFRWFREKYDLHVQIRKEDYFYKNVHNNYFHFDISKGQQQDITGQQDLYGDIMDECEQDILGNHLDNEKLNILIFERGFAFNTYEETELACLLELINICKKK